MLPPLPTLGDPEIFLHVFENGLDSPPAGWEPRHESDEPPKYIRPMYKHFEVDGDSSINKKIKKIIDLLVGQTNHKVLYGLYDIAKSNNEFAVYTTIFELWKFVRHKPVERGWPNTKADANRAANLWEVYWGAIFEERALWGVGDQDLDWIFHSLLYSRYKSMVDFISFNADVNPSQIDLSEAESQWETETVFSGHPVWLSTITDLPLFINPVRSADQHMHILGYSTTTVKHTSSFPSRSHQITAFGFDKDDSRKRLKYELRTYYSLTLTNI